jgi:hypothetical protein
MYLTPSWWCTLPSPGDVPYPLQVMYLTLSRWCNLTPPDDVPYPLQMMYLTLSRWCTLPSPIHLLLLPYEISTAIWCWLTYKWRKQTLFVLNIRNMATDRRCKRLCLCETHQAKHDIGGNVQGGASVAGFLNFFVCHGPLWEFGETYGPFLRKSVYECLK